MGTKTLMPRQLYVLRTMKLKRQPNGLTGWPRTFGPRGNNSDRCQWQGEGAVVGAALQYLQVC